jgi:hypothetical protein
MISFRVGNIACLPEIQAYGSRQCEKSQCCRTVTGQFGWVRDSFGYKRRYCHSGAASRVRAAREHRPRSLGVRRVLFNPAGGAIAHPWPFKDFCERWANENSRPGKVALIAVMRDIPVAANAVARDRQYWRTAAPATAPPVAPLAPQAVPPVLASITPAPMRSDKPAAIGSMIQWTPATTDFGLSPQTLKQPSGLLDPAARAAGAGRFRHPLTSIEVRWARRRCRDC